MTFYTSVIIMTELMMIAMLLHVLNYSGFTKTQKTWYLLTFISIMLCAAAEYAVHCGYYNPAYKIPLTVITVLQFSISPLLGVLFTGALGLTKQAKFAIFFVSASAVAEIISAPFGLIFYFAENGYQRGNYFFIYGIFYFVSLLYLIVCMTFVGKRFRHRDAVTIIMILVILVAGIVPMTLYKLNITYIAIALSASLCYIYYNDLVQQDIKSELVANQKKLTSMQEHIITSLASLIENRDTETGGHVSRTAAFVETLARDARNDGVYSDALSDAFIDMIRMLAPMHDVGKIVVSDKILRKPGKLTEEEYEQMKQHTPAGGEIIREVLNGVADDEYISAAADIAACHHEKWNGKGYPKGLKGEEIPLSARIMAIADVFDALVSKRCYKEPIPADEAFRIIEEESGEHFDPKLVEVFLNHREDFCRI